MYVTFKLLFNQFGEREVGERERAQLGKKRAVTEI